MSERRMFAKAVTESDRFLSLPFSAQALYFHLNMAADDEGFVNNVCMLQRMLGSEEGDLERLAAGGFVLVFDSGIVAVRHWKINNCIRADRTQKTVHSAERGMLTERENGIYDLCSGEENRNENGNAGISAGKTTGGMSDGNAAAGQHESGSGVEPFSVPIPSAPRECGVHAAGTPHRIEKDSGDENSGVEDNTISAQDFSAAEPPAAGDFAAKVFAVLSAHDLPCCGKNPVTFAVRDFRLGLAELDGLGLHSDGIIRAVENYAQVIGLMRQGKSWWKTEQSFYSLCKSKNILKFLPDEFDLRKFAKSGSTGPPRTLENKIQL